jgi:hypothetical protein
MRGTIRLLPQYVLMTWCLVSTGTTLPLIVTNFVCFGLLIGGIIYITLAAEWNHKPQNESVL